MNARRVLMEDELLAPFNLGVSVRQGVATVWGAVPSVELAGRAVEKLRRVRGLLEVRSQLHIDPAAQPPPPKPPPQPPLMPLEPRWPRELVGRPEETGGHGGHTLKVPRGPRGGSAALAGSVGSSPPNAEAVSLLPPVASTDPRLTDGWSGPAGGAPANLSGAIGRLQQADPRFRLFRHEVRGGVVELHGLEVLRQDMLNLAETVARLPGVERVILKTVQTDFQLWPLK